MRRLHRRDDPGGLEARQVGRIGDLQMLDPPAPRRAIAFGQTFVRPDDLRIGGITDGVDRELIAARRRQTGLFRQLGIGQERQPARSGHVVIRRLEPRPARSKRPVGVQLDPAKVQPVSVQPRARLAAVDRAHRRDATGIIHDPDVQSPPPSSARHRHPIVHAGAHVGRRRQPGRQHQRLRLGQRGVIVRSGRCRDIRLDECHRRIDEQAVFDPPASRRLGLRRDPRDLKRRRIADCGVPIDPAEPHRPAGDHRVEVGGGREALVGP